MTKHSEKTESSNSTKPVLADVFNSHIDLYGQKKNIKKEMFVYGTV